jgi:ferredoxin
MTRYVMVADLRRCVGCQTCTAACKETPTARRPGVQWRRVLDIEAGEYPDVRRSFVPVRLPALRRAALHGGLPLHRDLPSAPTASSRSTTTCASAAPTACMACPYEARYMVDQTVRLRRPRHRRRRRASTPRSLSTWSPSAPSARPRRRRPRPRAWCRASTPRPRRCARKLHLRGAAPSATSTTRTATSRSCWPRTAGSACTRTSAPARASTTSGTRRPHHEPKSTTTATAAVRRPDRPAPRASALGLARRRQLHRRRHRQRAGARQRPGSPAAAGQPAARPGRWLVGAGQHRRRACRWSGWRSASPGAL